MVDISQRKQSDGSLSKDIGTLCCIRIGEFNDNIDTMSNSTSSTFPLINDGGFSTLHEITRHDGNQTIAITNATRLCNVILMPVMKGIVFCDNTAYLHKQTPFFSIWYLFYHIFYVLTLSILGDSTLLDNVNTLSAYF